jgi:Ca-activated chloride channel family protein
MKHGPSRLLLLLVLAAALALPSGAQEQKSKPPDAHVDVTVTAITIAVTVQDTDGRLVNNLSEKDFTVYENGKKRTITYFKQNYFAPLGLTVLLDVSGSMAVLNKLEEAKAALREMATSILSARDELSLLIFADGQVEVAVPFSKDREAFLKELDKLQPFGQTALNDAVAVSPEFANRVANEKRALLLITDGVENDSQLTPDQALEIARRVDVPIYTIGYKIPMEEQLLKMLKKGQGTTSAGIVKTLDRFSQATGGRAYFLNGPEEMLEVLGELKKEQTHQYIIGYTTNLEAGADYRLIRVTTSNYKYKVRTRQGY